MKQAPAHPKPRNNSGSVSAAMSGSGYRFPFSVISLTGFARFPGYGRAPKLLRIERLCFAARLAIFALSAMLGLAMPSSLTAQITELNNTPKEGVGHNYIGMLNETVNPENGQVSLRLDFSGPPGRKLDPKFALSYNSSALTTVSTPGAVILGIGENLALNNANGWSYTFPYMTFTQQSWPAQDCGVGGSPCSCIFYGNYVFYDSDGSGHNLPLLLTEHPGVTACAYQSISPFPPSLLSGGDEEYTASMPDIGYGQVPTGDTQVTIRGRDGAVYQTEPDAQPLPNGYAAVESIEDRNGNIMHVGSGGVTDDLGRSVVQAGALGSDGAQVTVSGLMSPYTLHWAPPQNSGYSVNSWPELQLLTSQNVPNCQNGPSSVQPFVGEVLTSLVLPNGQQYTFTYDPTYGTLSSITYPSGGKIEYVWGKNINAERAYGSANYMPQPVWPNSTASTQECTYEFDTVVLTDRYVSFGSGNVLHQKYAYGTTFPPGTTDETSFTAKTTTVTTYDLTVSASQPVSVVTYTYGSPAANLGLMPRLYWQTFYGSPVPVETMVDTVDGLGNHLSTVTKSWLTPNLLQSFSTTTYTNAGGSLTSGTSNTYDSTSWQRTEEDDCDFVSGSSINCGPTSFTRKTTWAYETYQNLQPSWPYGAVTSGILDESCQKIVEDHNNNHIAETDSYYDNGTTLCGAPGTPQVSAVVPPASTHDETNYGASSQVSRGNLTKSVSLCFAGSWTCPQNPSTTTYSYDETGQVTSMTDANLHTTNFGYTDNYTALSGGVNAPYASSANTNARLTSVIDPSGYTTWYAYDYSSGQLTRVTDPNSQSTTYVYNDSFSRPTQANYPDGGQTTISYNDSPPSPSVTTTGLLSSNPPSSIVTTKVFDGMGHPVRTILSSDPYGPDYTDTSYYGTGRVYQVSNPYRSTSDPTYGTTTYAYDGLGRKVSESHQPDGSVKQWCYNDVQTSAQTNCKSHASGSTSQWDDYADENGNDWQQTTDGLGRLIAVNEPNGSSQGPSMETDYQYDLLNNLTKVTQNGNGTTDSPRVRTFTYDSLSQLLCANNPENSSASCPTTYNGYVAGTTGYWYDPNGNLSAKEDARGVTTSYSYDQLNRLLSKSYSDGFTPTSCYLYDSAINGIHRLASEWTQQASMGSCSSQFAPRGGYFSARWIRGYDAMGRLQAEQQYTPNSIATGKFYPMSYTYDLAGNVTSSTAGAVPPGMTTSQASAPCASAPVLNTQMFTFLSCYDAAGRLQGVTSNASSGPSALLFTAQWYPPFTGLPNAVYGNSAVTLTRAYDPRLRITSEQDLGNSPLSATNGSALLTITGDEQSH